MHKFDEINEARKLLELPEKATMAEIKSNYRKLLAKWHPDKHERNKTECNKMTQRIVSAYETIMDYCHQYQYSFSDDAVKRHLSPEEWWFERFGNDPLWGTATKKKDQE